MNKPHEPALPNLEPELLLIYAIVQQAKRDALGLDSRPYRKHAPPAALQQEAREFLHDVLDDLRPVCA